MKAKFLDQAYRTALSKLHEHPQFQYRTFLHFSFIVADNKVLGYGCNKYGSPYYAGYPDISNIHSETDAYRKYRGLIRNDSFDIINIRLNRQGNLRMSKPCRCCNNFLAAVGCDKIVYSTDEGFVKQL